MTTLIVLITILAPTGVPISGAWVEVEGMVRDQFYVEQVTDSRGRFAVEVEPGVHAVTVSRRLTYGADVLVSSQLNANADHTSFTFYTGG